MATGATPIPKPAEYTEKCTDADTGCPLRDYETILNHIRTTKTKTGLRVRAKLITTYYPTGIRISDKEFKQLRFEPSDTLPKWNYVINPLKM